MSEKLAAFITLYNEKAAADVESAKEYAKSSEEKLKRAEELWSSINTETTKLGITNKFLSVFPEPGGKANVTIPGTGANPNYIALLQYGEPMDSLVKELATLKSAKQKLVNANNSLSFAETLVATKPEDHLNNLGTAIVKKLATVSSLGAKSIDSLLKSVFEDYDSYGGILYQVEGADGPSNVNSSEQAYEVLKEKYESGNLSKKSEEPAIVTSPINEPTLPTEPAPTSPLNPEVEVTPETETGVTNTSAVTGAPTQLPPETQAPPTEGGVTVNVEASPPVQTVPQETVPGTSAINEIEIKAAQEKLASGPMAETLKASGINLTSEKVSEILSNKETVQSQIQTIPTGTSPIDSPTESTNNVTEKTQTTISSEKSGASVINELEIKKAQEKLASGPLADLLKASGINLTSEKISDVLSVKEKEKADTTTTSQTNQINQVDEKVKTSQIDSTLEATTTKQNISGETTNKENLGVTKDQMMIPKAPPPSEPSPGPSVSNVTQTPQGQAPPETITGTETTLNQGGETQAGPTQGAGPSQPAPSIGNLSELEARLARIEFLLSGPLDVKIIE